MEQWTQLEIVTGKQGTILMKGNLNSFMNISCKIFFKILYNNSICQWLMRRIIIIRGLEVYVVVNIRRQSCIWINCRRWKYCRYTKKRALGPAASADLVWTLCRMHQNMQMALQCSILLLLMDYLMAWRMRHDLFISIHLCFINQFFTAVVRVQFIPAKTLGITSWNHL